MIREAYVLPQRQGGLFQLKQQESLAQERLQVFCTTSACHREEEAS